MSPKQKTAENKSDAQAVQDTASVPSSLRWVDSPMPLACNNEAWTGFDGPGQTGDRRSKLTAEHVVDVEGGTRRKTSIRNG